jgi:hypothetical protein
VEPSRSTEPIDLLDAEVRIPDHVVFRSFARETVALNLETGHFHGLNVTAGRMVDVIRLSRRARDAVDPLAAEFGVAAEQIERDVQDLLAMLRDRGLVDVRA